MNPPNFEVSGASNPLQLPSPLWRRICERATPDPDAKIRPNGTLRILVADALGRVEFRMVFPCEWVEAGTGRCLALIRNPYLTGKNEDYFLLCLADGRVFTTARNIAVARIAAFTLIGRVTTADAI